MPTHALAGHLAATATPLAAVLALLYALAPRLRRGLRWPALAAAALAEGTCIWAGAAGSDLYRTYVDTVGADALRTTAYVHAKAADDLTIAAGALLIVLLAVVWRPLAPDRPRSVGQVIAIVLVTLAALATFWTTWTTVSLALESVWAHHTAWKA